MSESEVTVAIEVDGQHLEGRVTLPCFTQIRVEMTSPYRGVSRAAYNRRLLGPVPDYDFVTEEGDPSTLTEKGWRTARELLAGIYDNCKFVEAHQEALLAAYRRIQVEEKATHQRRWQPDFLTADAFCAERRKLRERLKGGEIDQRPFGRLMHDLNVRKRDYKEWLAFSPEWHAQYSFKKVVDRQYGRTLEAETLEEVVVALRSQVSGEPGRAH